MGPMKCMDSRVKRGSNRQYWVATGRGASMSLPVCASGPNLEAHREMHQVEVHIVQLQVTQGLVQADRDVLWAVVGAPQLGSQGPG